MVEHALKRGWPTCDPREKYLQPSVTSIVPVMQRNKHNISTEKCKMKNVLAQNVFTNYNSSLLRQHTVNQNFFVFYPV